MGSVARATAKQLDFKMKFMGLAVVFMVLNLFLSPTESAPFVILVPAASTLPLTFSAGTGALLTGALLVPKTVALKGALLAKGAIVTAAALTAQQQVQQEFAR